jgi:putative serine protease PepD
MLYARFWRLAVPCLAMPEPGHTVTTPPDPSPWGLPKSGPPTVPTSPPYYPPTSPSGAQPSFPSSPSAPTWSPPNPPPPLPSSDLPPPSASRRGGGWRALLVVIAALALLLAGILVGRLTTDDDPGSQGANGPSAQDLQNAGLPTSPPVQGNPDEPVAAVAEAVAPAVVQIETSVGLGSGVVYDPKGLIITNNHVVEGSDHVNVVFSDGSSVDGEVLGTDPTADIAVVKVPSDSLLGVAVLCTNQEVRVGQVAVAIGSPFGLDQTVTSGIVSAVDRPFEGTLVGMIQTDAPINHGNSGGALADREGCVIGINAAIASTSGDNNGLGFAIPISLAYERATRLANGEAIETAVLGVRAPQTDDTAAGALIGTVDSGSGADHAGMKDGDIVTAINGQTVRDFNQLATSIFQYLPGDTIHLTVVRDGQTLSLDATLGAK